MAEEKPEVVLSGLGVSGGVARGVALPIYHSDVEVPAYEVPPEKRDDEVKRFEAALVQTRHDIQLIKKELEDKVGEIEASIFDAHMLLLEDVAIIQETISQFRAGTYNIDYYYMKVVEKFIAAFGQIDDPFMRERISDIKDVSHRVLGNLLGKGQTRSLNIAEPAILVSEDFSPSDFALIAKDKILGIITERGSKTSHTAIIARSLGVPCIVGISSVAERIANGDYLLIDGYNGKIAVNPSAESIRHYEEVENLLRENRRIFVSSLPFPSETTDGVRIRLSVNINSAADISEDIMKYSDGVGLFRTENLFLDSGTFLEEEQQFEAYKLAVQKSLGKPVVIRTLDLGGDKNFQLMKMDHPEENPFMGYRAIRFCLDHEDVFIKQLRAILRAGVYGPVKIMFPMISSLREIERARLLVDTAKEQLAREGIAHADKVPVGAMIEVPSAAMIIDMLADYCDFVSIGTNDLIQYMIAVDRVNDKIASLYEPMHPAVLRILDKIVSDARKFNLPVSVCGEMASDPVYAPLLIGMGVTELSMSSGSVGEIKFLVRKISRSSAEELRREVLKIRRSREIVGALRAYYYRNMKGYLNITQ